jgi:hypothetical protein
VIRGLFSVLMMLLTLHVSAAEALRACADQEQHAPAQHEDCDKTDTRAPKAPTSCCDAMASCSTTLAIDGAADEERVIPDRDAMLPRSATLPSALEQSPEPPPPKGKA